MLFAVLVLGVSACFEQPEFPDAPRISFNRIAFKEVGTSSNPDSLLVKINFQDGDGDLGLSTNNTNDPFHGSNYFMAGGDSVGTFTGITNENPPRLFSPIIQRREGQSLDKLATVDKIGDPGFEFMEDYVYPYTCLNYLFDTLYVMEPDLALLDASYNIVDTITNVSPHLYVVAETFYFRKNPNYFNITVRFYEILSDNSRKFFNWETLRPGECGQTFDGRFPILTDADEARPLEGTLSYGMESNGFIPLLGGKTLQLEIQITDRSLKRSNVLVTPPFRLDQIRE